MLLIPQCTRCGYATAPAYPRCWCCGRPLHRCPRSRGAVRRRRWWPSVRLTLRRARTRPQEDLADVIAAW